MRFSKASCRTCSVPRPVVASGEPPSREAGVGDHDQVATAEAGPIDALDGLGETGVAVLGERARRYFRRRRRPSPPRRIAPASRPSSGRRRCAPGTRGLHLRRIVAVGDHAEAHPLFELRRLDLLVHLFHRRAGEVDVGLHRGAGVDDEDDAGGEPGEIRRRINALADLRQLSTPFSLVTEATCTVRTLNPDSSTVVPASRIGSR